MSTEKQTLYSREKQITLTCEDEAKDFVLWSLSAKAQELALKEAQEIHSHTIENLTSAEKVIRSVYLLQDIDLLKEALLDSEQEEFIKKASLTFTGDEADYQKKIAEKADVLKGSRYLELGQLTKEHLAEKLTAKEMNRQIQVSWNCAILQASLVRALRQEDGQCLFQSAEEMKQALPAEIMEKLCEVLVEFLTQRGTAQVFPKPHTFKS